jgi:biopolymer transport protein ExbD
VKLARPPERAQPETIVALIDVVLFLLIFFMLVGRMDATAPFELEPAISRNGAELPGGGRTVSVGADGAVALDGARIERAALFDQLAQALTDDPDLWVRINADRRAELRHVLPLVTDIETLGARDVVLVVTPAGAP